jgi:hypothetical protein
MRFHRRALALVLAATLATATLGVVSEQKAEAVQLSACALRVNHGVLFGSPAVSASPINMVPGNWRCAVIVCVFTWGAGRHCASGEVYRNGPNVVAYGPTNSGLREVRVCVHDWPNNRLVEFDRYENIVNKSTCTLSA